MTDEDRDRGDRLRRLRERVGKRQHEILGKEKYQQVTNIEKGRNKLTGRVIVPYARAFGVDPEQLERYRDGKIDLDELLNARRADAPPANDTMAMAREAMNALVEHDGVKPEAAWFLIGQVVPSTPSAFAYYRGARRLLNHGPEPSFNSLPPGRTPADLRRKLSTKRR